MKKNKLLTLTIATVTTLCIAAGATYAWFVDQANVSAVDVSTGKVGICVTSLKEEFNKLPGDVVLVSKLPGGVKNTGTVDGIIELSFDNNLSAKLATAPDPAFLGDYINDAGVWKYSTERLLKVASMEMREGTFESKGWVKIGNKYYGKVGLEDDEIIDLGDIYLNIGKELGGFYKDPANSNIQSPSRQFEQGTIFAVGYTAKSVQCTKAAIVDNYGQIVADTIPSAWYN